MRYHFYLLSFPCFDHKLFCMAPKTCVYLVIKKCFQKTCLVIAQKFVMKIKSKSIYPSIHPSIHLFCQMIIKKFLMRNLQIPFNYRLLSNDPFLTFLITLSSHFWLAFTLFSTFAKILTEKHNK